MNETKQTEIEASAEAPVVVPPTLTLVPTEAVRVEPEPLSMFDRRRLFASRKVKDDQWQSGPPPSPGWWPASISASPAALRWWDGKRWSQSAFVWDDEESAAVMAKKREKDESIIASLRWQQRPRRGSKLAWPEASYT